MQDQQVTTQPAPCPKCRSGMAHVTDVPHRLAPNMLKSIYVCRTCNQTRTYILPACKAVLDPAPGVAAA